MQPTQAHEVYTDAQARSPLIRTGHWVSDHRVALTLAVSGACAISQVQPWLQAVESPVRDAAQLLSIAMFAAPAAGVILAAGFVVFRLAELLGTGLPLGASLRRALVSPNALQPLTPQQRELVDQGCARYQVIRSLVEDAARTAKVLRYRDYRFVQEYMRLSGAGGVEVAGV